MNYLRGAIFIIFLCIVLVECKGGGKSGKGGIKNTVKNVVKTAVAAKMARKSGRWFSGAWAIISVIMLVIIVIGVGYYASIFYPLICAKRGKYDVMEMNSP